MRRALSDHFAETVCGMPSLSFPKHICVTKTSSGQYKTIIMADSQSICPTAKPAIYLCFQIIWQLWLAVNATGILVISLLHFPFLSLLSLSIINPARELWLSHPTDKTVPCWNASGNRHLRWDGAYSYTYMADKVQITPGYQQIFWSILRGLCVCLQPAPSKWFFLFFLPNMFGSFCVTGRATNRIWGRGRGSFTLSSCVFFYVTYHHLLRVHMLHSWT